MATIFLTEKEEVLSKNKIRVLGLELDGRMSKEMNLMKEKNI